MEEPAEKPLWGAQTWVSVYPGEPRVLRLTIKESQIFFFPHDPPEQKTIKQMRAGLEKTVSQESLHPHTTLRPRNTVSRHVSPSAAGPITSW